MKRRFGLIAQEQVLQAYSIELNDGITVAAATEINYDKGQVVVLDLQPASITTLTFINVPTEYAEMELWIYQGSTARNITWPASFNWPSGAAITLSTGNDELDRVHIATIDGGTTWHASFINDSS